MKFSDLPQAKKAAIGEQIVDNYLRQNGFIPYHPSEIDGAHPFDRLVASKDKKRIFIGEIKTKPARFHYPDTGINKKSYQEYQYIHEKYGIRIFLFFVDEKKGEIYGNYLDLLDKKRIEHRRDGKYVQYPLEQSTINRTSIRYWPTSAMELICKLDNAQIEMLCEHTTRSKQYEELYERNNRA